MIRPRFVEAVNYRDLVLEGISLVGARRVWATSRDGTETSRATLFEHGFERDDEEVSDARFRVSWHFVELIILIVVIALVAFLVLSRGGISLMGLIVNAILGVLLIFLTNLILSPPIPINIFTILICAIGGVLGWLIILVLHLLQIAF